METMDTIIWVLQVGLTVIFLYFGSLKMFLPLSKIEKKVSWAHDYSVAKLRAFGFLEFIGAIGLMFPWRMDIFPILTPMAATGLSMVMAGAGMVHLKRDEVSMLLINLVIVFLLAGVGFHSLVDIFGVEINN